MLLTFFFFFLLIRPPPTSTLFPYTTLFRSDTYHLAGHGRGTATLKFYERRDILGAGSEDVPDRKSTRLNSSHVRISYAVFCLKKKNKINMNANTDTLSPQFQRLLQTN